MDISDADFRAANRRGTAKRAALSAAKSVRFDRHTGRVVISLSSGLEIAFAPQSAQGLENAQPADLAEVFISPSGLSVHFPKLDAEIYIPALLQGILGTRKWMAAQMGRAGGSVITAAKTKAARENGRRGGRPKTSKGLRAA